MTPWHETTKWPFRPKARPEMNANKTAAEAAVQRRSQKWAKNERRKGIQEREKRVGEKDVKDIFWLDSDKCLLVKTMK